MKQHGSRSTESKVRQSLFPISLLVIFFVILLVMSGIHVGLIILMNRLQLAEWLQPMIALGYWAVIAFGLCGYTGWRIKRTYEKPMREMAEATSKVANGDFSVYIPPRHTADQLDYLDVMFQDFNKMVEELGSIETLKIDFFSNVSHEIKTPLAVIQNNAELLRRGNLSEAQRAESTETILSASKRLSGLITNMLKLNRLEKQVIKPMPEEYDLCAQLAECMLQFESVWEQKRIEPEVDMEDRTMVYADAGLLEIVWTNLLSNAMKFTPEGGTVTLRQKSDREKITVTVEDTGCGMDPETARHIFDKFYQGDTSRAMEGNGLGLALVHRVLELSDGIITVESEVGKGTKFTVVLPYTSENKEV